MGTCCRSFFLFKVDSLSRAAAMIWIIYSIPRWPSVQCDFFTIRSNGQLSHWQICHSHFSMHCWGFVRFFISSFVGFTQSVLDINLKNPNAELILTQDMVFIGFRFCLDLRPVLSPMVSCWCSVPGLVSLSELYVPFIRTPDWDPQKVGDSSCYTSIDCPSLVQTCSLSTKSMFHHNPASLYLHAWWLSANPSMTEASRWVSLAESLSHTESTHSICQSYWRFFRACCFQWHSDPLHPSVPLVADFLFQDKLLRPSMVKG